MKNTPDRLLSATASDPALALLCDEIIERLQAGDRVDMASLALEHPEHADPLRRLLPALEALVDLGASSAQHDSQGDSKRGASDRAPRVLGDYRILREIGRGGMGVVYEAEQRSLNRRVALKVLPMAAALDARQFQRFQLEAQAAACLHHNNIVPVFAVGTEGGVPFYAMQYIEGRSLAQIIHELRRAEGLDPEPHAPEAGVEPRLDDLSTTALALSLVSGRTATPQAHALAPDSPTEAIGPIPSPLPPGEGQGEGLPSALPKPSKTASSTRTRDYCRNIAGLGLQAAEALDHAHARGIIHRDIKPGNLILDAEGRLWVADFGLAQIQGSPSLTLSGDVLGTLRYMSPEQALGKRVIIDGRTDVYSLGVTLYELLTLRPALDGKNRAEILRKIGDEEPTPLQKLNPSIPHDLETIVRKAMAKEPSERYAAAKELADDLRNYLEARPIRARRPSLLDRAAKWARRHTASVAAASVILILAMIGLVTSTILITREQRRTTAALDQAESRLQFARKAVDEMYTQVAEKWLKDQPSLTKLQREFLEKALALYQTFASEKGSDPQVRYEAVKSLRRVGTIQRVLGKHAAAEKTLQRAVEESTALFVRDVDQPEIRFELASCHYELSGVYSDLDRRNEAEHELRRAIDELAKLRAAFPAVAEYRERMADAQGNLASLLTVARRLEEAEAAVRAAFELRESLVKDFPENFEYRLNLADTYGLQGMFFMWWGKRRAEAAVALRQGDALLSRLQKEHPRDVRVRSSLSKDITNLGMIFTWDKKSAEAEECFRRASSLEESLSADFPDVPAYQASLALTLTNLASTVRDLSRVSESEVLYRKAVTIKESLAERHPEVPQYQSALVQGQYLLARTLEERGAHEEARRLLQQPILRAREKIKAHPGRQDAAVYRDLAVLLAEVMIGLGDHAAAVRLLQEVPWDDTFDPEFAPPAAQAEHFFKAGRLSIECVLLAERDPALSPEDRNRAARDYAGRARSWLEEAARRGKDEFVILVKRADLLTTAPVPAFRDPQLALQLARRIVELKPGDEVAQRTLGWALYRAGDWKGSVEALIKSMGGKLKPGDSDFFLAMNFWQLGDHAQARALFDREEARLPKIEKSWHEPLYPDLAMYRRMRAEAAALMGVQPPHGESKSKPVAGSTSRPSEPR